jgi:DNA invertase Pin-like site-specific DNA recombinase
MNGIFHLTCSFGFLECARTNLDQRRFRPLGIGSSKPDDGYSAKDTRRPAYLRMINDIKRKKVNLLLVCDLSRLSRNIFDFCHLMDDLEKVGAQFLSLKEQFDTSTPAGKMMIYNMINLLR